MSRIVIIDTETSGFSPAKGARVIEIGAVEVLNGKITGNSFHSYLNPGAKIESGAYKVHGIKQSSLEGKPPFTDVVDDLLEFCKGSDSIMFYNADFDIQFLEVEFALARKSISLTEKFSTNCLMKQFASQHNKNKNVSLDNACLRYGIDISKRKPHGALIDAQLTAKLYLHMNSAKPPRKHTKKKVTVTKAADRNPRPIPRAFTNPEDNTIVQLNFCKNPNCSNYGVPALNYKLDKNGNPLPGLANDYTISQTEDKRAIKCNVCGDTRILINNRAVANEINRLKNEYRLTPLNCPDKKFAISRRKNYCRNHFIDFLEHHKRYNLKDTYYKEGKKGQKIPISQRIQCKACKQMFRVPLSARINLVNHESDALLFRALMNKNVLNRICEIFDVSMAHVYNRIRFFYRQCIEFDQWHIKHNVHNLKGKSLSVSMDRQHYLVNWTDTHDSRPTKLVNTSTIDNFSRFAFASTLNFDFTSDWKSIRKDNQRLQDENKPIYRRKYAQYILSSGEIEADDAQDAIELKAPNYGLLVHQTYSTMAHLETMKRFYQEAKHVTLFADNDEGFELCIATVLKDQINSRKVFPVLIKAERNNASQSQDKQAWADEVLFHYEVNMKNLDQLPKEERQSKLIQLTEQHWLATSEKKSKKSGVMKSEWLLHPFTHEDRNIQFKPLVNLFGSEEQLQEVTDSYDGEVSKDLLYTSLQGVDNYFQMIRRRINTLERPITSATNGNRWNGYAAYNPQWSVMLLEMLRVYNNYILNDESTQIRKKTGKAPKTPAQKLGIADKPYTVDDILDFTAAEKAFEEKRFQKEIIKAGF